MTQDLESQLLDKERLSNFLDDKLSGDGPFDISRHLAGHSCETFFLSRGDEEWVLRRPPLAVYLPTAHDVMREHRVLAALADTPVRSPRPLIACDDESVIGAPFYVMERVRGHVIRTEIPPEIDNPSDHALLGTELVDALAQLHAVDYEKVGLEGFGKPVGYLERQVRRWTGQLELATSITKESRELPEMWQLREWLTDNMPDPQEPVIVQGDYKLDNVMYTSDSPARLIAIFDWEMSTIGDPFADLGWLLSFWRQNDDPEDPLHQELSRVTTAEGFLTRQEMIARYEEGSGRTAPDMRWYVVAAIWKLASLLEGSYGRHLLGTTDDPFFAALEQGVPALARGALDFAGGRSI